MVRSHLISALMIAVLGGVVSCDTPCKMLSEQICNCEANEAAQQACLRRVETESQSRTTQVTDEELSRCSEIIEAESCTCDALAQGELVACGLAVDNHRRD